MKYEYILLGASIITAINVIIGAVKNLGKNSKTSVDTYIEKQIAPSLKQINDGIDNLRLEMKSNKKDADEVVMKQLRYTCLCFASDIRKGIAKTRHEYEEIFRMETDYDNLIEKYGIENGFMEEEMLYVHEQYRKLSN